MIDATKIAIKYINQVQKNGIPVTKAYLFGSYAKKTANKYSDIDICVVSPIFGNDYFNNSLDLKKIANKIDYRISPVPFGINDLEDKYSTLASEINSYGASLL
ncbi:MAG: nucleotidyltransferase domain-containing protein [Patescibacteria group bacterium]